MFRELIQLRRLTELTMNRNGFQLIQILFIDEYGYKGWKVLSPKQKKKVTIRYKAVKKIERKLQ
jgi:sporulation protein YlmC with PRC-barrel domain